MNCSCSSGLGLSGDFSVPLSEVEAGSMSRNSTQVSDGDESLQDSLVYITLSRVQELMCLIGGSAAPCLLQREGVDAFWWWRLQGLHVDVHRLQVRRLGGRGQLLLR